MSKVEEIERKLGELYQREFYVEDFTPEQLQITREIGRLEDELAEAVKRRIFDSCSFQPPQEERAEAVRCIECEEVSG